MIKKIGVQIATYGMVAFVGSIIAAVVSVVTCHGVAWVLGETSADTKATVVLASGVVVGFFFGRLYPEAE